MARTKKKYANGQACGGTPGRRCKTAFGAPGNAHRTPHRYVPRSVLGQ